MTGPFLRPPVGVVKRLKLLVGHIPHSPSGVGGAVDRVVVVHHQHPVGGHLQVHLQHVHTGKSRLGEGVHGGVWPRPVAPGMADHQRPPQRQQFPHRACRRSRDRRKGGHGWHRCACRRRHGRGDYGCLLGRLRLRTIFLSGLGSCGLGRSGSWGGRGGWNRGRSRRCGGLLDARSAVARPAASHQQRAYQA